MVCCSERWVDIPIKWLPWSSNAPKSWNIDRRDYPKTTSDSQSQFIASKRFSTLRMASGPLEVGVYCLFACYNQRTAARRNLLGPSYLTAHLGFVLNLNYCCEHRMSRVKVFQPTELLSSIYRDANLSRFPVARRVVIK